MVVAGVSYVINVAYIKKDGPKQTPEGYHQWRSQALKPGWAQRAWGTEVLQRGPGAMYGASAGLLPVRPLPPTPPPQKTGSARIP